MADTTVQCSTFNKSGLQGGYYSSTCSTLSVSQGGHCCKKGELQGENWCSTCSTVRKVGSKVGTAAHLFNFKKSAREISFQHNTLIDPRLRIIST